MLTRLAVRGLALLGLVCAGVAAQTAERVEVALVNATVTADDFELLFRPRPTVVLTGRVDLKADRIGTAQATVKLTADKVTVITGPAVDNDQPTISEFTAEGNVHIEASTDDAETGETRHAVTDCARVHYDGRQEVIRLYGTGDGTVELHYTHEVRPTPTNGVTKPDKYEFTVTGRKSATIRFSEGRPTEQGPAGERP